MPLLRSSKLGGAGAFNLRAFVRQRLDVPVQCDRARFDAPGQHAAKVGVGLERGDQHGEGMLVAGERKRSGE